MKRALFVDIISCLLILLFTYAAVSKLLDYQKFRIQLGQSPLLTSFAGFVAWILPSIEMIIGVMLAIPRLRLTAFYLSFSLITMFTAYIIAITKFSDYVPCSCGGILQSMNWNQHLVFNIFFLLLALVAILFSSDSIEQKILNEKKL